MTHREKDPTHASFFIIGAAWIFQFCMTLILLIVDDGELMDDFTWLGTMMGIAHVISLLTAAWEDLRYDTHHLRLLIILAIIMNFIIQALAMMGILAIVVGAFVIYFGGFAFAYSGSTVLTFITAGSVSSMTVSSFLTALFVIGTVAASLIGMSAW